MKKIISFIKVLIIGAMLAGWIIFAGLYALSQPIM